MFEIRERLYAHPVFLERNKRTEHGEKDTNMNYTKHLINQTLSLTSQLKEWHEQGTWCV
jgi:hypothetical protein